MATSDSEDFESADEDVAEVSKKEVNLKSGVEISNNSDLAATPDIPITPNERKNDNGAGDVLHSAQNDNIAQDTSRPDLNVEKGDAEAIEVVHPVPVDRRGERKRRQKPREPTTSRAPKKLGTKVIDKVIPPAQFPNIPTSNSGNQADENKEKLDGDNLGDQQSLGQNASNDASAAEVDPYAKFKGYSLPPSIQRCWETDVDDNVILDDFQHSSEPMKSEDNVRVAPVLDKLSEVASGKTDSTWGGWGNWGVTTLLTSATEGVSTLTSHVSSVLESGIGAPNPEELARIDHLQQQKLETEDVTVKPIDISGSQEEPAGMFNFGQLLTSMSSITKLVETTGSKVLSGGLDTLETIGKKTMEVLQEGDPGLKKKRAMFSDTTVLSQILREAKEKAEKEDKEAEDKQALRNIHFETLFDDYQGLVHLEALEMLSKQCDLKLQTLLLSTSGSALSQLQDRLQELKEVCQLPDDEDVTDDESDADDWWKQLAAAEEALGIPIATDKLDRIWKDTQQWLKENAGAKEKTDDVESDEYTAKEIHKKAVSTLAQLTAISVEQFHKGAELILIKETRDPLKEAETLKQITSILCVQVSTAATHFCESLNNCTEKKNLDSVNSLITNIFLEASNSSSYIQEAFQLLIPVLQVGLIS